MPLGSRYKFPRRLWDLKEGEVEEEEEKKDKDEYTPIYKIEWNI